MADTARLLGFAFANADLLIEIDRDATVVFATGAASEFVKDKNREIVGSGAARLFEPSDGVKFVTYAKALGDGGRAGPLRMKLAGGRDVSVSLCHLPQNGSNISCTLTHTGRRQGFGSSKTDTKTGLPGKDGFLAAANAMSADHAEMMLVNVPGLDGACAKLPPKDADRLMQQIGAVVKEAGPKGAGRVGGSSFGAIAEAGKKPCLAETIKKVLAKGGLALTGMAETVVSLKGDLSPEQRLLALRHVVSRFAAGESEETNCADLSAVFERMLGETQSRALALTGTVADGAFSFAYQPVQELASGALSHCEALVRFEGGANTGETVAFAEALGISDAFDVAVAAKILSVVEQSPQTRVSFNLSGNTIATPMTFGLVAGILAKKRALAGRVLIEVTESAEIADLAAANLAIQALRSMGYKVGLDDFGAGAASFQYLHAFDVDFVKFDNALIGALGGAPRVDSLIGGLVKLCGELGVITVAEGIENAAIKKRVIAMGFQLGQGYYLGKPAAELPEASRASAKRKGTQISWS